MKTKILFFFFIFLNYKTLHTEPLVNIDWVANNICNETFKVIEIGKSLNSYEVEHISCSIYTNFYKENWRIKKNKIPFTLPEPNQIKNLIEKLGIKETDTIVLYPKKNDKYAMAEVTAIYFTFKYVGHINIFILNGSFKEFKKNYPLKIDEGGMPLIEKSSYKLNINLNILANYEDVKENIRLKKALIDSRENDFFYGINKLENIQKLGTIKGSKNIPSMWNLESRKLKFNQTSVLKKIYEIKKIDGNNDYPIFFCNAGLESSLNWFVSSEILKHKKARLYDASLYDWINRKEDLFVE